MAPKKKTKKEKKRKKKKQKDKEKEKVLRKKGDKNMNMYTLFSWRAIHDQEASQSFYIKYV